LTCRSLATNNLGPRHRLQFLAETGDVMATVPQPPEGSESFRILFEQEADERWLAEVPELPGVMAYGKTKKDAEIAVTALALRVIADRTEQVRKPPKSIQFL